MKLVLDHHYSPRVAEALQQRGHDVVAAVSEGWEALDDDDLLAAATAAERSVLTADIRDFARIAGQWLAEGRPHHGIVFAASKSYPRRAAAIGHLVDALEDLMVTHPAPDALAGRVVWL